MRRQLRHGPTQMQAKTICPHPCRRWEGTKGERTKMPSRPWMLRSKHRAGRRKPRRRCRSPTSKRESSNPSRNESSPKPKYAPCCQPHRCPKTKEKRKTSHRSQAAPTIVTVGWERIARDEKLRRSVRNAAGKPRKIGAREQRGREAAARPAAADVVARAPC